MSTPADGPEDVNDFLQRIKELGDRRDQEDEERNRKLEEEILQGKKERQARRAERARSISPTKSSPTNTPTASRMEAAQKESQPPSSPSTNDTAAEARRETPVDDAMEKLTGATMTGRAMPAADDRDNEDMNAKTESAARMSPSGARNSPLPWQRRPTSQASDRTRSRPLSMVATENAARSPRPTPEPSSVEPTLSREQIAQSLASKDPAWFRQTADRGLNSPAYRKNQVEDDERSDHGSTSSRVQMPGMSRGSTEPEKAMDEPIDRSAQGSPTHSRSRSSYQASPKVSGSIGSPVPLTSAQRFEPPGSESSPRGLAMSPSQGRISPDRLDRPASPTKGMGGFVQSAMMKRSDSVSKRWSVTSPTGLNRGNSVASNRSHQDSGSTPLGNILNSSVAKPSSLSREASPNITSRPTSSHSNATLTQDRPPTASSMRSGITTSTNDEDFVKPTLPASRSETPQGLKMNNGESSTDATPRGSASPPTSPTKTMDTRRWSPTKASWLESALNKPDSPKPKTAPPPQQPAWMSEINKAKSKASVDLGRSPTVGPKHEVNIGGLMRSPPPGGPAKPPSVGGLPAGFSSGLVSKSRTESLSSSAGKDPVSKNDSSETVGSSSPAVKSPPLTSKAKPETPPKKDFRGTLKPRQPPPDGNGKEEPEFKNVFGQLRRTQTKNYVAPDVLKDNITRGKAALNVTGGPKKTERVDEFKDAILKKKEDFKKAQAEGKGVTRSTSGSSQNTPVPEALARKKSLAKADGVVMDLDPMSNSRAKRSEQGSPIPSLSKETSAPARLQSKEGGKLAGRFNPALAGLLARGPPSMASDTSRSSSPISQRTVSMSTSTTNAEAQEGPQLMHMTKGRARGPKRKAPSSTTASKATSNAGADASSAKPTNITDSPTPLRPLPVDLPAPTTPVSSLDSPAERASSQIGQSRASPAIKASVPVSTLAQDETENPPSSPRKLDMKRRSQFLQEVPNKNNKVEVQSESPRPLSPVKRASTFGSPAVKTPGAGLDLSKSVDHSMAQSPSPTKSHPASNGSRPKSISSVKNITALWDRPSESPQPSPRARSPIKLPTHDDEKANMIAAGLRSPSPEKAKIPVGLGIQTDRPLPTPPSKPTPPPKSALSPPPSASRPATGSPRSPKSPRLQDSLVPQATEASMMLIEFFGEHEDSAPAFKADTAGLLAARPDPGTNIKSLRSALYQLSPGGKKQLVPSHQERILFEGNLYICTHTFGNAAGKKVTEVYFWVGDEVPSSVAEEAQIFAQREARSSRANLVVIRQGKETPEFFHALGGIIIIRRGTSNRYDSLAPHILCGRKHFGQIAFDEVDFSAQSLCSGFPYLISTQSGKCYLWKGKGSGIDELSCARLIGMDFGLTGEIEEVEDGSEPESFLKIFKEGKLKSADHWRMRPNYNKYCNRLFCAGSTVRDQIVEISPFCQADLSKSQIYVLDAFFEIYIIVGARAQSQYAAFQNALTFAQEYGMLAAGMEDRPFLPVSTVVIEGVPRDLKSVFRKWRDDLTPTRTQKTSSLQRGRSLRVVPLNAAIEATR